MNDFHHVKMGEAKMDGEKRMVDGLYTVFHFEHFEKGVPVHLFVFGISRRKNTLRKNERATALTKKTFYLCLF